MVVSEWLCLNGCVSLFVSRCLWLVGCVWLVVVGWLCLVGCGWLVGWLVGCNSLLVLKSVGVEVRSCLSWL